MDDPLDQIPPIINKLVNTRSEHRKKSDWTAADAIRQQIQAYGYDLTDTEYGPVVSKISQTKRTSEPEFHFAIFGSGESATTGRSVHEILIHSLPPPVTIGLLETPAGYEDNPHHWYRKLKERLTAGLANYHPKISLISALRNDSLPGTNDPETEDKIASCNYIHLGAGSPTYAIRHLKNSLALSALKTRIKHRQPLSIASAAAIAFGKYALPVYEIYFAGHDVHWMPGLNIFGELGFPISIVPHWNNQEGGGEIDTRFAYLGQRRFTILKKQLPPGETIVGIDEHTALLIHVEHRRCVVKGKGQVTVIKGNHETAFSSRAVIPWELLAGPGSF